MSSNDSLSSSKKSPSIEVPNPFKTPLSSDADSSSNVGLSPSASSASLTTAFTQSQPHQTLEIISPAPVRGSHRQTNSLSGLAPGSKFTLNKESKRGKRADRSLGLSDVATLPAAAASAEISGASIPTDPTTTTTSSSSSSSSSSASSSGVDREFSAPRFANRDHVDFSAFSFNSEYTQSNAQPNTEPSSSQTTSSRPALKIINPQLSTVMDSVPIRSPNQSTRPSISTFPASSQRKPSVFVRRQSSAVVTTPNNGPNVVDNEQTGRIPTRHHFISRRLPLGHSIEKPWLTKPTLVEKLLNYIIIVACAIGLALVGILTWLGTTEIENYKYCPVLEDNFESDASLNNWLVEQQVGGFGNGEFEWATNSRNNSYVKDGKLYIVPTLTSDAIGEQNLYNGYTVNLTTTGTCTGEGQEACSIRSNSTAGTMIPPIQSARLTTINTASITYGKVEVRAKLPKGDWLWPAIWMMPVDSVYGAWPASGEIDIAESRGNSHTYPDGGNNVISSTLHWGPTSALNQYWRTHNTVKLTRTTFPQGYHTFAIEWSKKYLATYLDGRLRQIVYHPFKTPFWSQGSFPSTYDNGTAVTDPWPLNNNQAPFDQAFYLILNVAVGGTNGFFADNVGDKPWNNGDRQTAMMNFWNARDTWSKTWGDDESRGMVVDSVKMYRIC
ncbi:concanavalin A-like lectin/glucanase domain-containing protein [Lipomyces japonicus]|uniref:concanavalin A-like lectin/glucanase domain-containing protein n=1 Tax=Lipomyces japonicus TaxID=56871 RepID=UPI0034CFD58F